MSRIEPLRHYNSALLAYYLRRLSDKISEETGPLLEERGIELAPRTVSVALSLSAHPGATTTDLADWLGLSHQLVSQRLAKLIASGLAEHEVSPADRRRRQHLLTAKGEEEVEKMKPFLADVQRIFDELFGQIQVDLLAAARKAIHALEDRTITQRFRALHRNVDEPS